MTSQIGVTHVDTNQIKPFMPSDLLYPTYCWKMFKQVMTEANISQSFHTTVHTGQHGKGIRPCVCILYFIQEIQA